MVPAVASSRLLHAPVLVALVALAGLAGCAASPDAPQAAAAVTGIATYRERMALPPDAVFEASIEEVSRAGAPSVRVAETRVTSPRVPIHFSIPYDASRIDPRGSYNVRARILSGGELMFTTNTAHPVLGSTGTTHVDLLLYRAAAPSPPPQSRSMRGIYLYMADAASFQDCASGRRMPVATEGDNVALQTAYLAAREKPGAPMLAYVEGQVVERPRMEGPGTLPTLLVERFIRVSMPAECG